MEIKHARTTNNHTSDIKKKKQNIQTKVNANCNTKKVDYYFVELISVLLINCGM